MPAVGGRTYSNGDTAIGIGLLVGLIAVFLPWYRVSFEGGVLGNYSNGVSGFNFWTGLLFFLAVLVGIALFVIRNFAHQVKLPDIGQPDGILYLGIGAFMAVMAIVYWLTTSGDNISGPGFSSGPSFGLFLGLLAGLAVAAGGVLKRTEPQLSSSSSPSFGGSGGGGSTLGGGQSGGSTFGGGSQGSSGSTLGGGTQGGGGSTYGGGTQSGGGSTFGGGTPPPAPPA